MGIAELLIFGIPALVGSVIAVVREIRGVKNVTRAQLLADGAKVAFRAVETLKERALAGGKRLTNGEIQEAFKQAVWDYVKAKGVKGFTMEEIEDLKKTAEVLVLAGKYVGGKLR